MACPEGKDLLRATREGKLGCRTGSQALVATSNARNERRLPFMRLDSLLSKLDRNL
jgi:hypothetical protein